MSSDESDRSDPDPGTRPAEALDALEDRTLDGDDERRPSGRVDQRTDDGTEPAFDLDLDPDDQGRADAGAEQSG